MQTYLVLALLFAVVVAIFAVQNSEPVHINFLHFQFKQISLVLVILGSAAVGAIVVFFLGMVKQLGLARRVKELEHKNRNLTEELSQLKSKLNSLEVVEDQVSSTEDTNGSQQ